MSEGWEARGVGGRDWPRPGGHDQQSDNRVLRDAVVSGRTQELLRPGGRSNNLNS